VTTIRRGRTVLALLGVAVVAAVVALVVWRQQAVTPSGAICGSVWHNRPGAPGGTGGFMTVAERAAATQRCHDAAAVPFWSGAALLALAVLTATAGPVVARRGRRPARSA
jgi:hypothetical protein